MAIADVIRQHLPRLSADQVQDLGIRLARLKFPELFPYFNATATSALGRTTKALSDASLTDHRGKECKVEITSTNAKQRVVQHLCEEIEKIRNNARVFSSFVYISSSLNANFSFQETEKLKTDISSLGIDLENIHLIWGSGLVVELEQPAMRRILLDYGFPVTPKHFRLVKANETPDGARLARPTETNPFVPTESDLREGLVHTPALLEEKVCLVKGLGASGKTVLAWLAGMDWASRELPSWYLDLRSAQDAKDFDSQCEEDIANLIDNRTLFIVDNCHLDEEKARRIFNQFADGRAGGASLLLLGRELTSAKGSGIWGINGIPTKLLVAGKEDVMGVFRRLAARRIRHGVQDGAELPMPDDATLGMWLNTFGHGRDLARGADLILFSAAVNRKVDQLIKGDFTLVLDDAVEEMREHYVLPLSESERTNLYALATVQQAEAPLDLELLPHPVEGLSRSREELGLVIAAAGHNGGSSEQLEFVHSSLASLFLKAGKIKVDSQKSYLDGILGEEAGVPLAGRLLYRFEQYGLQDLKEHVRQKMRDDPRYLAEMRIDRWKMLIPMLFENDEDWQDSYLVRLVSGDNLLLVVKQILSIGPDSATFGFRTISSIDSLKSRLFPALVAELCLKDNAGQLKHVHTLVGRLLDSGLNGVTAFLGFVRSTVPFADTLWPVLSAELNRDDLTEKLSRQLAEAPCSYIGSALNLDYPFYEMAFKAMHEEWLLQAPGRASRNDVENFGDFQRSCRRLGRDDLARALAIRLVERADPAAWHLAAGAKAQINLSQLTRMIAISSGHVEDSVIYRFVEAIATPDWLDKLYSEASAGGLAGNLFYVWLKLDPAHLPRFKTCRLQERVNAEAGHLPYAISELANFARRDRKGHINRAHILSLIGAASLFGLRPAPNVRWPNSDSIEQAFQETLAGRGVEFGDERVTTAERVFWLGLRVMGSFGARLAKAPSVEGERMLRLWAQQTEGQESVPEELPSHVKTLNVEMVQWLERCRDLGWWLAQDP
jgi:hypothetical protein